MTAAKQEDKNPSSKKEPSSQRPQKLTPEVWKDIPEYEDSYQVSDRGRVKSLPRKIIRKNGHIQTFKSRMLKPLDQSNGYLEVCLSNKGDQRRFYIHRLVAQAFISNSKNLPEVNHKDENKHNNFASNLEWCDREYNNAYGSRLYRQVKTSERNGKYERFGKKMAQIHSKPLIMSNAREEWTFPSTHAASQLLGYSQTSIARACRTKGTYKGAYWKYV